MGRADMRLEEEKRPAMTERGACGSPMPVLAVRVDGNGAIGAGHVARCCSVAAAALAMGIEARFFVSDRRSREMLALRGYGATELGGDVSRLAGSDAQALARALRSVRAVGVLVDSYGVTAEFAESLGESCSSLGVRFGYIDDLFRYEMGFQDSPEPVAADVVVNYSFGASPGSYERAYRGRGANLLIGPKYAPIGAAFAKPRREFSEAVGSVLVTTGSTNPGGALERIARCCREALPNAEIHVVVGRNASFSVDAPDLNACVVHKDPGDMRAIMEPSDVAVSAAGTTLYELAALGVPTVAIPVVENQMANILGWSSLGLGPCMPDVGWGEGELRRAVAELGMSPVLRRECSEKLSSLVDGGGARRIVEAIVVGR